MAERLQKGVGFNKNTELIYGDDRLSCGALVWRERRARPRVCAVVALLLCCSLTSVVRVVTETAVLCHGQSRHCSLSEKAR